MIRQRGPVRIEERRLDLPRGGVELDTLGASVHDPINTTGLGAHHGFACIEQLSGLD